MINFFYDIVDNLIIVPKISTSRKNVSKTLLVNSLVANNKQLHAVWCGKCVNLYKFDNQIVRAERNHFSLSTTKPCVALNLKSM